MRMKPSCTPLYDSRVYRPLVWVNGGPPTLAEDYRYHIVLAPRESEDGITESEEHPLRHLFKPCGHCHPDFGDLRVYGVMQCYHERLFPGHQNLPEHQTSSMRIRDSFDGARCRLEWPDN